MTYAWVTYSSETHVTHIFCSCSMVVGSDGCPCGLGGQNAKHVLQECLEYNLMKKYWPTEITYKQKLNRIREELQTTAGFILEATLAL